MRTNGPQTPWSAVAVAALLVIAVAALRRRRVNARKAAEPRRSREEISALSRLENEGGHTMAPQSSPR